MAIRMTRRQLAISALAPAAQAQAPQPAYGGPLDNFTAKVELGAFDPVAWTRARWESMPRRLRFAARTRREAEAWQRRLRTKLTALLGGFPAGRPPLKPLVLETKEYPGYRRTALAFETRPGMSLFGYLLVPKAVSVPVPAVVCVPGHGRGVDDIVGIDQQGRERTNKSGYQHDFALQVVEMGVAAFAIEPLAFGCRRDETTKKKGLGTAACQPAAGAALLFGETMIGWRVWDVMRSLDFLSTRPEIDARRLGCMGISGGGTATLFSSALDERIRVAMISGYLCTFRDSILSLAHCIDNYVPGILEWAEMPDIAGLIAPRPLFAESGERDNIFPIAAFKSAFAEVSKIYSVFGAADRCAHEIFPNEHIFHGAQGLPFLKRHLTA
jgi:dienelactone hydrolase